jgi:hypothetical protein
VNQDGEKVTTEVAQKQLRYFSITPHLKRLFISKRTARHMGWHKEDICDTEVEEGDTNASMQDGDIFSSRGRDLFC